jgi:hypothetical protein
MILKCPFCKADAAPSQQTCPACSKRMTRRCPACAEDIAIDSKNCKYCGEDIANPSASRTPDIQFIEETPKKRKCCGKFLMALVLLAGLGTAAVAVRTDCVACSRIARQPDAISTSDGSYCGRRICSHGKTPLWATVWEKMGGKACSKMRKDCSGCCGSESVAPAKDGWY